MSVPFLEVWKTKLFYLEGGKGKKRRLLLVHGAGGNSRRWEAQLEALSKECHVIALDLPGHGSSEGFPCEQVFLYREWVREFAEALGWKRFVLAGHSLGGAIAQSFALNYPEYLEGLILVSTGARLRVHPEVLESYRRGESNPEWVRGAFAPGAPEELLKKAISEAAAVRPEVYYLDFLACDRFDFLDKVQGIRVPTQVICGQEDQRTPVKYSEFLAARIPGARLSLVPGAGHMVLIEKPEEVNRIVEEFLLLF